MNVFSSRDVDDLLAQAMADPRRRKARALKPGDYIGVRPLLNAMLPGTYIQPHLHPLENADEYWFTLQGKIASFSFTEEGDVKDYRIVSSKDSLPLTYLPQSEYHTLVVVDEPAVILEITQGPYDPNTYKEFASWAPSEKPEDEEKARVYLQGLEKMLK
ncbi:cupin fold metalloprotein, WbuC family [Candidatus Pacearchaeota archaeon]|nr:cupin fold metalloprotein, WbuC family [Candidatus Pacearchaeota archaeon]